MANKFKLNDTVIVTTGKSKGVVGSIMSIDVQKGKVKIKDVNMKTIFEKANPQENKPGAIRKEEGWIDISNVAHYDSSTKKSFKVGFRVNDSGKKVRYNKSTDKDMN